MSPRRNEADAYGWRTDPDRLDVEADYGYLLPRVRDGVMRATSYKLQTGSNTHRSRRCWPMKPPPTKA
jgi:hypothetical protein